MSINLQPDEQPDLFPQEHVSGAKQQSPSVSAALEKFWQIVRQSAEVIVTLRQENALVNAQNVALRKSEQELQARVDDLLQRIEDLESKMGPELEMSEDMRRNIDRAEDQLKALNESVELQAEELHRRAVALEEKEAENRGLTAALDELNALLEAANLHAADNAELLQQLNEVRAELAARAEQLETVSAALEALKSGSATREQMPLFASQANHDAALADRLDALADRLSQLFGIS